MNAYRLETLAEIIQELALIRDRIPPGLGYNIHRDLAKEVNNLSGLLEVLTEGESA